jgi:hypothetical protein
VPCTSLTTDNAPVLPHSRKSPGLDKCSASGLNRPKGASGAAASGLDRPGAASTCNVASTPLPTLQQDPTCHSGHDPSLRVRCCVAVCPPFNTFSTKFLSHFTPSAFSCHPAASHPALQAQEAADARISDLQSTLDVCQSDADNLRYLLSQAELQHREAERQAAIANAAGGQQHRCGHRLRMVGSLSSVA